MAGGNFKVDRRIWNHKLDASAFAVYLYLVKTADNYSKLAHPCLRKISDALNLCRNTVIAKVRLLHDRMLLVKENRKSERIAVRSFKGLHSMRQTISKFCNRIPSIFSLARMKGFFKERRFWRDFTYPSHFLDSGGSFLAEQVLYPPRLQQKKE
ncbi:helix-turn-helix domain-containing protein [Oscillospiraceae bacterium PP1C4]